MSFTRPTLTELIGRSQDDIDARLPGADSRLRRSAVGVLATVHAGAVHGRPEIEVACLVARRRGVRDVAGKDVEPLRPQPERVGMDAELAIDEVGSGHGWSNASRVPTGGLLPDAGESAGLAGARRQDSAGRRHDPARF